MERNHRDGFPRPKQRVEFTVFAAGGTEAGPSIDGLNAPVSLRGKALSGPEDKLTIRRTDASAHRQGVQREEEQEEREGRLMVLREQSVGMFSLLLNIVPPGSQH